MTLKNGDRFTVYDAMEAAGAFSTNPANIGSRTEDGRPLYTGPVKFPMLVYHPQGFERVLVPGTMERTSYGTVEKFGELMELISKEVSSEEELAEALAEGWHKHPAGAIRKGNETWRKEQGLKPVPVPPISASSRIADLEEQNRRLTEMLEQAKKDQEDAGTGVNFFGASPSKSASAVSKAGLV